MKYLVYLKVKITGNFMNEIIFVLLSLDIQPIRKFKMRKVIVTLLLLGFIFQKSTQAQEVKTLALGSAAPAFNLMGIDDKMHGLDEYKAAEVLVLLFTCNHCPTAQAYEQRVQNFVNDYANKNVKLVAIQPNADKAVRFDELGYTDLNDSFEEMKIRAKDQSYTYPYLYDGETQEVAKLYGPVATPHVFVFDKNRILQYNGRIDDDEHIGREKIHNLRMAVDAVLAGKKPEPATTKIFGCSIKWMEKAASKQQEIDSWAKETVSLANADLAKLKAIMSNTDGDGKYRLVNVWATWCGPCVAEFSGLVESDKMYRHRDFELVTISADEPKNTEKVLKFLNRKMASNQNYHFTGGSKYEMIEAIDPNWQGALPYTVLLAPDGRKIYTQMGEINVLQLRKIIADNIGRYFD